MIALSSEMRRLRAKWIQGNGWPKRLEWLEIQNLRGWESQRFELRFPIMAVVGENGAGKSTILQCAASVYGSPDTGSKERFASDFFPDTAWDQVRSASIGYSVREGGSPPIVGSIRKPTDRWRGNPARRKRPVSYIDLSRIQPVSARLGFVKLANPAYVESEATPFEADRLARVSQIMGRRYELAKMASVNADTNRRVPVLQYGGHEYSGFHQGAGETTIAELLEADLPRYGLILIDEVESSLHPRAQRRLIRDLAERCRSLELQIILTTHSPYVLEELPLEARAYIVQSGEGQRDIVYGVSPELAMTRMDEVQHHECDVYVEDNRAARMVIEVLTAHGQELVGRCRLIPYGASSVGQSLGQMVSAARFPQPSCVFLDGDCAPAPGCVILPGDDAPERVVLAALQAIAWGALHSRVGRNHTDVADACLRAMTAPEHHEWVRLAATALTLDSDTLWQAMCAEWATACLTPSSATAITQPIDDALSGVSWTPQPAGLTPTQQSLGLG